MSQQRLPGRLYVNNIVSTYVARLDGVPADIAHRKMNIEAVTFSVGSKLSFDVFPASVSKSRIQIADSEAFVPSPESVYPIKKKRKIEDVDLSSTVTRKKQAAINNKKIKLTQVQAKLAEPKQFITATDSTFHSNQNVVAGGKSIVCNILTAYMFLRRLSRDMMCHYRLCNLETQNIVCSADMGYELNLDWIMSSFEERGIVVNYTPEEFSGCSVTIYGIVFVLFSSGKIVATGIKTPEGIQIAENQMHELFDHFRKGTEPASFDATRSFMRDGSTLQQLKDGKTSERRIIRKQSASDKSHKKLTNGMREMMKSLGQTSPEETADYLSRISQEN